MRDRLLGSRISDTHFPHVRMRTPLYTLQGLGGEPKLTLCLPNPPAAPFFTIPPAVFCNVNRLPPRFTLNPDDAAFSTISNEASQIAQSAQMGSKCAPGLSRFTQKSKIRNKILTQHYLNFLLRSATFTTRPLTSTHTILQLLKTPTFGNTEHASPHHHPNPKPTKPPTSSSSESTNSYSSLYKNRLDQTPKCAHSALFRPLTVLSAVHKDRVL